MCIVRTKPDRAEDARQKRDEIIANVTVGPFALFGELRHHVDAQNVSLPLFHRRRMLLPCLTHGPPTGNGVLDPQPVRHLMEHDVGEKRVERDVLALIFGDQHAGYWHENAVELGLQGVLQLKAARTLLQLHGLVVRKVDGDGLRPGIGFARIVDNIICVELRIPTRNLPLVAVWNR